METYSDYKLAAATIRPATAHRLQGRGPHGPGPIYRDSDTVPPCPRGYDEHRGVLVMGGAWDGFAPTEDEAAEAVRRRMAFYHVGAVDLVRADGTVITVESDLPMTTPEGRERAFRAAAARR